MQTAIENEWIVFSMKCLPHVPADSTQFFDMRAAFYAGAVAHHEVVGNIADEELVTDAGVARIEAVHQELIAFFEKMKAVR